MTGMRDVARRAGVSLSTVSLVVNDTGYVSHSMRSRVETAMKELNYVPNQLARNFYRDSTKMIGMIVPTIRHPFFARLTAAVQHALASRGYQLLLCSAVDADQGEATYVDMLRRHMMDGIIMAAHTSHDPDYWHGIGRPIVAFDRYLGPGIPSVFSDHEQGGRLIADLFLRTHIRHLVMLGGPRTQFHDLAHRQDPAGGAAADSPGRPVEYDADTTFPTVRYYLRLEDELRARGVRYDYVEVGEVTDMDGTLASARTVFDRFEDVDAIVGSDLDAAVCVQEAVRRGIDVPARLQVVAYDGTYLADVAGMCMTAIRQDFDIIAALLARRVIEAIETDGERSDPSVLKDGQGGNDARATASGLDRTAADMRADRLQTMGDVVPVSLRPADTTR